METKSAGDAAIDLGADFAPDPNSIPNDVLELLRDILIGVVLGLDEARQYASPDRVVAEAVNVLINGGHTGDLGLAGPWISKTLGLEKDFVVCGQPVLKPNGKPQRVMDTEAISERILEQVQLALNGLVITRELTRVNGHVVLAPGALTNTAIKIKIDT